MDLSIVVPLYNEEDNVGPMHAALERSLNTLPVEYEIIFVDDGSVDQTCQKASILANSNPALKLVKLRRNCGQTAALACGIDLARGRVIITLDGDLQNDPADIPLLLQKIQEGNDIVVGWRQKRRDKLLTRKIPSVVANWIIGKVTGVPIRDNGCTLKAYRADVIKQIPLYSEMHRFIPAMASLAGARVAEVKVRHHARQFGQSKYGLSRIYKVLLDLVTIRTILTFVSRPSGFFAMLAALPTAIVLTAFGYGIYQVLVQQQSYSLMVAGIGLLFATLTASLLAWGVLAELICQTGGYSQEQLAQLTLVLDKPQRGARHQEGNIG